MEREFGWIYKLIFFLSEKRPWYKQKDVIWTSNRDEKVGMMPVMSVWKEKATLFYSVNYL